MNNRTYDILKYIAQIVLPAAGTCYAALGAIWHVPSTEQVLASVVAVDTMLGAFLGISSANYSPEDEHVGTFNVVNHPDGKKVFMLDLNGAPENFLDKKVLKFKVQNEEATALEEH